MSWVGSSPPASNAVAMSEVVVVLPWAPAIATVRWPRASAPIACCRFQIGTPDRAAAATSRLSSRIALETTTTSGEPRSAGS